MSIIETHLFSQYLSAGIPGGITSLALTVYGISAMLGAVGTGFLGRRFRMKNVLASVYGIRILIAVTFIFLPKTILSAFLATAALGLTVFLSARLSAIPHYGLLICAFALLRHLPVFS